MKTEIRLDKEKTLKVCPHIEINGYTKDSEYFNSGEYREELFIECKICKNNFKFDVLIN